MNRLIYKLIIPSLLFYCAKANAQTGVVVSNGTNVVMTGSPSIVLSNSNFINNGTLTQGNSNLIFTGSAISSEIGGSGTTTLYDLTIDEATAPVVLMSNIGVENNVTMTSGNIELNTYDIDLGTTGMLMNESETSRITGTTGGRILRMENLTAPNGVNPGNIGAEITTTANLGLTQIVRGHVQQTGQATGIGIGRYYDIVPAPGQNTGLNATLDFHYFDAELLGLTEAALAMSVKSTPSGWWFMIGDDGLNTVNNVLTKNAIDTFSRHTLTDVQNNPLPLTLLSFTGQLVKNETHLKWNVAHEKDILKYDVERSADGKKFSKLGSVTATGNSDYSYIDREPFSGYSYYRLRVHEANNSSLTNIVKVRLNKEDVVNVYPNPVTDKVQINFYSETEKTVSIKLLDVAGKLVTEKTIQCMAGGNSLVWDLSALAQATYYLQIEGQQSNQIKLIKL
jgi:archaellum component FlaF (FlaF/FlaG flagellin family)